MKNSASNDLPHVLILGCGFAGLFAVKTLANARLRVTVVDRTNHHLFQPLLYQIATAGLSTPGVAAPIRNILADQNNVTVFYGEVQRIDSARRVVVLDGEQELGYDYLVVATGASSSYFGNERWATYAPSLKTLQDAYDIRRRVLLAFERAEREVDPDQRAVWLSFVVIGAGATGVELAGAFAEIARHTLQGEFRRFDPANARVVLIESGDRVLPGFPAELSEHARKKLERLGVTVWLGRRVTDINADGVQMGTDRIASRTVIWAAGVAASPLGAKLGLPLDRAGRVLVEENLSVAGHPEIMVVGDLAALSWHQPPVPGTAPAAKQMGTHAAQNILRLLEGQATQKFRYRDYGMLATIGRNAAVAVFGKLQVSGYPAWLLWLLAHIFFLIGFRNRIVVMIDWAWSYWTFERHARIVADPASDDDRRGPA